MLMVGGGVWKTAPGQITDDGELTLALAHALSGTTSYDVAKVAQSYRKWFLSHPFDVGNATTNAFGAGEMLSPMLVDEMLGNAGRHNLESKANGSLMRLSALGAWSVNVGHHEAVSAAKLDARLSHPNPTCQWAAAAYVVAIRHLVLHAGDSTGAIDAVKGMLSEPGAEHTMELRGWLEDALDGRLPAFHPSAGFVRIGFTHAFHHLFKNHSYEVAIAATLAGGGDTDTNACIVGGLIGALHGAAEIPEVMRSGVIGCNTAQGRPRPEWLHTTNIKALVGNLIVDSSKSQ
jgi:ADP-ribosylglycohydrolase